MGENNGLNKGLIPGVGDYGNLRISDYDMLSGVLFLKSLFIVEKEPEILVIILLIHDMFCFEGHREETDMWIHPDIHFASFA